MLKGINNMSIRAQKAKFSEKNLGGVKISLHRVFKLVKQI